MSWWSDLGCPVRWTIPFTDICHWTTLGELLPCPPVGNQFWFQEGQNGTAKLPVVRRWGPCCLSAYQHISRKSPCDKCHWSCSQEACPPHGHRQRVWARGTVCYPGSDLFPRVNSRNIPSRECILPPSPSLRFSLILQMHHDYLPLSLLWGCHVASCTLGILQRTP